jgi:hypothetical protein
LVLPSLNSLPRRVDLEPINKGFEHANVS